MIEHGTEGRYTDHACRCVQCREAHRIHTAERIRVRSTLRTMVDGRLVAPVSSERHGRASTYRNHSCRCEPCTAAHTAKRRRERSP